MSETRKLDFTWLVLVLLSVVGAGLGGTADDRFGVSVLVALVMAVKLRLVCDNFLELRTATPRIRRLMYAFTHGMPLLVILSSAFGGTLARLTGALVL
mgnify:FL=1